jgi:DNA repair exonuclease SbcCD ATPase subunit
MIIKEIPEMQHLEKQVSETAAVVTDWKNSIAKIGTQLNVAGLAVTKAQKTREAHALKASLGDAAAIEAIKHARDEQQNAEQIISDLKFALPAASEQLAEAEKAAASARHALAEFNADVLKRKRVDVAGQLDKVIEDFARLFGEYEKLGREILSMDVMPRTMDGISNHEGAIGARRVRASLPKLFWKLFPGAVYDEMKTENLAAAEGRFWGLAPIDSDTKAA